jgi:hypothetical protein
MDIQRAEHRHTRISHHAGCIECDFIGGAGHEVREDIAILKWRTDASVAGPGQFLRRRQHVFLANDEQGWSGRAGRGFDFNFSDARNSCPPGIAQAISIMFAYPVRHKVRRQFEFDRTGLFIEVYQLHRLEPMIESPRAEIPSQAITDSFPSGLKRQGSVHVFLTFFALQFFALPKAGLSPERRFRAYRHSVFPQRSDDKIPSQKFKISRCILI